MPGSPTDVTLVEMTGARCTIEVRYQGGARQPGLGDATARYGRASWQWKVPADVQAGPAHATVYCARAGTVSRMLVIVGRLVEPKIVVMKQGRIAGELMRREATQENLMHLATGGHA